MITLTHTPTRRYNTPSGIFTSNWVALHNPIFFHFQRQDYAVASVEFAGANRVKVTLTNPIASNDTIEVGDFVYLNSGNYDEVGEVASVVSSTVITLRIDYDIDASGGFINLNTGRENYRVAVQIVELTTSDVFVPVAEVNVTPDFRGLAKIDVHEWVKEIPNEGYDNGYDYETLNLKDLTLSGRFGLKFYENWSGNDAVVDWDDLVVSDATLHSFANAARQINASYGQNMAEYNPTGAPDLAGEAKWLTLFDRPTLFRGYPFDLQFIYSDAIVPYQVTRSSLAKDVNGTNIAAQVDEILAPLEGKYVNRLKMPDISDDTKILEVWIGMDVDILATTRYAIDYATNYDEIIPI